MAKEDSQNVRSRSRVPLGERWQEAEVFRFLVERIEDYAIFLLDSDGYVASWNRGLQLIKGYTAAEIIGQHISIFYTPEDRKARLPERLLEMARTDGQVENEGWRVRKDGTRFWADVVITALTDDSGELRGYGKVTRDLTARKETQDALSELSGRLIGLQDEERRRLVHELHDTTSPLLTSLTGKLYSAREYAQNNPALEKLVSEALTMAEGVGTMVRTISSMLYPPIIEQSGLLPALRWYFGTFTSRTGIQVNPTLPSTMRRLPLEHEVVLFRVVQEHLRASQVAGATTIRMNLEVGEQIDLVVESIDGQWARDLKDIRIGRGESGAVFAGMRERLRQLGGTMTIDPVRPNLAVRVRLPAGERIN
jgi:PAS domain S-box-containing protein